MEQTPQRLESKGRRALPGILPTPLMKTNIRNDPEGPENRANWEFAMHRLGTSGSDSYAVNYPLRNASRRNHPLRRLAGDLCD